MEYADAARNNLLEFLGQHDDDSLVNTQMTNRRGESMAVADMFRLLIWEVNQHGGQARLPTRHAAGAEPVTRRTGCSNPTPAM